MSTAQSFPSGPDRLVLNLASNNPFRNSAASPADDFFGSNPISPTSPFDDPIPPARPLSTNPFLDPAFSKPSGPLSPGVMSTKSDRVGSPTAEELFDSLKLDDRKPTRSSGDETRSANQQPAPRRNAPPRPDLRPHPARSQEDTMRSRRGPSGGPRPGGPSGPSQRPMERRPRRNSDSSLLIDIEKPVSEEEKKLREARRLDREKRQRSSRPNRRVDIIDQLDATSLFGTGAFHHDGPFDACNPHRNRKGSRRAPMNAFAKDSLNNSIGGSGPLNARPDHKAFMGTADDEAFKDYAGKKTRDGHFDPMSRGEILHGDQSLGLGTSTFLEGTPAARTIIQKREAEQAAEMVEGGLQRKKSLAQRFRGMNRAPSGRPNLYENGRRPTYPELPRRGSGDERVPNGEFGDEPETLSVRRKDADGPMSPTSPPPRTRRVSIGLERRATADGVQTAGSEDAQGRPGGGLLARVKSLKGGRKPRTQVEGQTPPAAPGTAA